MSDFQNRGYNSVYKPLAWVTLILSIAEFYANSHDIYFVNNSEIKEKVFDPLNKTN